MHFILLVTWVYLPLASYAIALTTSETLEKLCEERALADHGAAVRAAAADRVAAAPAAYIADAAVCDEGWWVECIGVVRFQSKNLHFLF